MARTKSWHSVKSTHCRSCAASSKYSRMMSSGQRGTFWYTAYKRFAPIMQFTAAILPFNAAAGPSCSFFTNATRAWKIRIIQPINRHFFRLINSSHPPPPRQKNWPKHILNERLPSESILVWRTRAVIGPTRERRQCPCVCYSRAASPLHKSTGRSAFRPSKNPPKRPSSRHPEDFSHPLKEQKTEFDIQILKTYCTSIHKISALIINHESFCDWSRNLPLHSQSTNRSTRYSTNNQSINQSIDGYVELAINRPNYRSINQSIYCTHKLENFYRCKFPHVYVEKHDSLSTAILSHSFTSTFRNGSALAPIGAARWKLCGGRGRTGTASGRFLLISAGFSACTRCTAVGTDGCKAGFTPGRR